jgi:molecular chaperone GrpE (heat shock protein)
MSKKKDRVSKYTVILNSAEREAWDSVAEIEHATTMSKAIRDLPAKYLDLIDRYNKLASDIDKLNNENENFKTFFSMLKSQLEKAT